MTCTVDWEILCKMFCIKIFLYEEPLYKNLMLILSHFITAKVHVEMTRLFVHEAKTRKHRSCREQDVFEVTITCIQRDMCMRHNHQGSASA